MKAVIPEVPQHLLDARARTGIDRWDEMWEGVLHMPPAPNRDHQDLALALGSWLRARWALPRGNRVHTQVNLAWPGGWPDDYRIPDLILLTPDRFSIDRNEYFEGPPTAVIEIRSPGDETTEKISFYAQLGAAELWIIDRDTKAPELHLLQQGQYHPAPPDTDGWLKSPATGIQLRGEPGNKVAAEITGDPQTRRLLPED